MARYRIAAGIAAAALLIPTVLGSVAAFAAPPPDACSLVTPAQVSAVLGAKVGPGERLVATSPKLCGFGGAGAAKRVIVAVITPDMFSHEKHPLPGIKEAQAAGLGDDAHYMTTPGFGTGLSVLKGAYAFKVRVYGFSLDQVEQKEKTLAQQILAKL